MPSKEGPRKTLPYRAPTFQEAKPEGPERGCRQGAKAVGGKALLPTLNSAESWGVYSRVHSARTSAASCSVTSARPGAAR